MTRPRRVLTPADVTRRYPSFRHGRLEAWEAESRDGLWLYARVEDTGTPWVTVSREEKIEVGLHGTLSAAREFTASGEAAKALDRLLAHARGEHLAQRDVRCSRC